MKICLFFPLLLLVSLRAAESSIDRLEPLHWWVGMRQPDLQLLVYGDNVASLEPRLEYPGVVLQQTIRVPNPNYLFIDLLISEETPAGAMAIEFLRGGEVVETRSYDLRERAAGSAERKGFGPSDVMYLITPDRFANGDPDNDTVEGLIDGLDRASGGGRHGGDLQGIIDHLDYIEEMGVTAIWVNPVLENAMPSFSYHGYATTDFYRVDPRFGSNEQYRELVRRAHARGIKVVMDMILNHCGSEHWFVQDPPTADWINFGGKYRNTNHRRTTNQDHYASAVDKELFADGWFVETMPDLNQRQPLMARYLIQNTIWWIEDSGLDGIRMDTYPYPDKHFMADWNCAVMNEYPHFNIVGEEWSLEPAIIAYWQTGKENHDGYTSCLPSLMDFPLQDAVTSALNDPEGIWNKGLVTLYDALAMDFLYPDPGALVIFPDNHDMDRFFTQVNEDLDLFKMGLAYYLTMRGVPQIYYGTEVLMHNRGAPGDHGVIRTDFPGGWKGDAVNAFTGEGLTREQKDTQAYLRRLLQWRKDQVVVHHGKLMHYVPEKGTYVYFRYTEADAVMVVLNKNNAPVDLALGRFAERLVGYASGTDVVTGEKYPLRERLAVPARTALVLELQ